MLLDLGTHLVDQALALFGPVAEVYGEVDIAAAGPPTTTSSSPSTTSPASAAISGPRRSRRAPARACACSAASAAFVVDALDGQEEALRAGRRPARVERVGRRAASRWGRLVRGEESEPVRSENGAWPRFYELVALALRGSDRCRSIRGTR